MAGTQYTIYVGGIPTHERYSRKEYALAAAAEMEAANEPYEIRTLSGRVVHEFKPVVDEPKVAKKFDLDAMKEKISKLLAKAEGTDNQAERDAFTEKAERLMVQLGINAAELEAAGEVKAEDIIEDKLVFTDSFAKTMVAFGVDVAYGFGNLTTLRGNYAQRHQVLYVIGHETDVATFRQLLGSLVLQSYTALRQFRDTSEERLWASKQHRFVMDRSFLSAYGYAVGQRLKALRAEEVAEASTGAALVLASKMDRVEAWKNETYPNLKKGRNNNETSSFVGRVASRAAGNQANIGQATVDPAKQGELR